MPVLALCSATGVTLRTNAQCADADWSMWRLASRTMWNPVQNLDVGVEVAYTKVNTAFGGLANVTGNHGQLGPVGGHLRPRRQLVLDCHLPRAAQLLAMSQDWL